MIEPVTVQVTFFYSHWHEHVITLEILQGLIRISATLQTINRLNLNAITVIFLSMHEPLITVS